MKLVRWLVISFVVLAAGSVEGADMKSAGKEMKMDPAMQEAKKRGAPGEHHTALSPFVGRFATTSRIWMKPDDAPQKSIGSAEHTWLFGGRFLKMEVHGDMGGQPFEGLGFLGYDNIRGEYSAVWLDNMNTGITSASGEFDRATRTYMESGTFSCPMTGQKDMRYRGVWKIVDADTLSYTMYNPGQDGREIKGMEISYKRVE